MFRHSFLIGLCLFWFPSLWFYWEIVYVSCFFSFVCLFQKERKKNIELGVQGGEVDLEAVGEGENMIKICFVKKETFYIKKPISRVRSATP